MGFCYTVPRCSPTRLPTVFKDKHRPWGFSLGMLGSRGPSPWQESETPVQVTDGKSPLGI